MYQQSCTVTGTFALHPQATAGLFPTDNPPQTTFPFPLSPPPPADPQLLDRLVKAGFNPANLAPADVLFLLSDPGNHQLAAFEALYARLITLRAASARLTAMHHLEAAADSSADPRESRLAATTLLRAATAPLLGQRPSRPPRIKTPTTRQVPPTVPRTAPTTVQSPLPANLSNENHQQSTAPDATGATDATAQHHQAPSASLLQHASSPVPAVTAVPTVDRIPFLPPRSTLLTLPAQKFPRSAGPAAALLAVAGTIIPSTPGKSPNLPPIPHTLPACLID